MKTPQRVSCRRCLNTIFTLLSNWKIFCSFRATVLIQTQNGSTEQLNELNIEQFNQLERNIMKIVKLLWRDFNVRGKADYYLRGKSSDGCCNKISLNLLHKTELCQQQQATEATFRKFKNWRVKMMDAHRAFLHSIAPTIVLWCRLSELWTWTHRITRIFASRKLIRRYCRHKVCGRLHSGVLVNVWLKVYVCVWWIFYFFRRGFVTCGRRKATDTHTLTSWCFLCTWTKAFTEIHASGRDFPIPLFPTSPFQMKIHYCVIVKFPVCRRRHMSESDEDRQHDLRFSSTALKMRALLVLHFLLKYTYAILSVCWWIGLDWGFLIFVLLRPCEYSGGQREREREIESKINVYEWKVVLGKKQMRKFVYLEMQVNDDSTLFTDA